jgi:putative acyl-CoA dehydrogenase
VRSNATVATPLAGEGEYSLVGHKWFFSAPMSDGFLVLARAPGGLTCFLLPRRRDDGGKNAFRIMRLKDKLGDWSNASSEVEFCGAWARRVGDEGRGVATIIEMVMFTRLDCMLGAAAEMRMALAHAVHHARHRSAFGKRLVEQPLMRNVLADLAIESEAALSLSMRVARAVDAAPRDPAEAALARIATAIGKYWICKRAPAFVNEAQECLGGAGYVEESILPRLYRQAPLNSIWEGSGNVQCLDVLRAMIKSPDALEAFFDEVAESDEPRVAAESAEMRKALGDMDEIESRARRIVERMAMLLQGSLMDRYADEASASAFLSSRLGGDGGQAFGTLPAGTDSATSHRMWLPP